MRGLCDATVSRNGNLLHLWRIQNGLRGRTVYPHQNELRRLCRDAKNGEGEDGNRTQTSYRPAMVALGRRPCGRLLHTFDGRGHCLPPVFPFASGDVDADSAF